MCAQSCDRLFVTLWTGGLLMRKLIHTHTHTHTHHRKAPPHNILRGHLIDERSYLHSGTLSKGVLFLAMSPVSWLLG